DSRAGLARLLALAILRRRGIALADLQGPLGEDRRARDALAKMPDLVRRRGPFGVDQGAIPTGANDERGLGDPRDGLRLQEILVNIAFAIGERNDERPRCRLSHQAGRTVALHPAKALLLLDGLGAPLGALLRGILVETEGGPRPDLGVDHSQDQV